MFLLTQQLYCKRLKALRSLLTSGLYHTL